MATKLSCDFCGKSVETISAKYYRAPTLPGKAQVSFMSSYSHYSDACSECDEKLLKRMTKRKARPHTNNNNRQKPATKTAQKKAAAG